MDLRVRALPALLALVLLLAGCIGGGSEGADGATLEGGPRALSEALPGLEALVVAEAPAWARGDAWSIVPEGGEGEAGTLVVTAAESDHYVLATTDEQAAAYDALHDISYLGRIRASDLAGHQGGQPVQFFSFPLTDGKTWQATWDGLPVTLKATWNPAMQTSVGIHPGFAIEGRAGEEPFVKYDYVPMLKWWSHLSFANGYGFKVQRVHVDWTGDVVFGEAKTLLERKEGLPNVASFTVEEGQSFVSVALAGSSQAWARALVLVDPAGQPYRSQGPTASAGSGDVRTEERLPPTPGEWRVASPVVHAEGGFGLVVRQVRLAVVGFA